MTTLFTFLKTLISEIAANGKLTVAFIINEIPSITSTPGVMTAYRTALHDQTKASYIDLSLQVLIALISTYNTGKAVKVAVSKV